MKTLDPVQNLIHILRIKKTPNPDPDAKHWLFKILFNFKPIITQSILFFIIIIKILKCLFFNLIFSSAEGWLTALAPGVMTLHCLVEGWQTGATRFDPFFKNIYWVHEGSQKRGKGEKLNQKSGNFWGFHNFKKSLLLRVYFKSFARKIKYWVLRSFSGLYSKIMYMRSHKKRGKVLVKIREFFRFFKI